jgi:hypothetical protein
VPVELSALALRCLVGSGAKGVHTGAAVQQVLELHAAAPEDTDLLATTADHRVVPVDPEKARRQRRFRLGMSLTALITATVLILGYAGLQVASVFVEGPNGPPAVIVGAPPAAAPAPPPGPPPQPAQPPSPIPVVSLSVYDPSRQGTPDNQQDVDLIVDGNPATSWSTDSYYQQFPAFKPGLGVMLRFAKPIAVSAVSINSPSPGTVLEVRTASSQTPRLASTTLVGKATLQNGSTPIQLQPGPPTQYLLLWITGLSGGGDHNRSKISEVGVQQRAS